MMDVKDMATIGLGNMQYKPVNDPDAEWKTLGSTVECKLVCSDEPPEWFKNVNPSKTYTFVVSAKKRDTLVQKCLYYQRSKKKRIRKKWDFKRRVLGIK